MESDNSRNRLSEESDYKLPIQITNNYCAQLITQKKDFWKINI